MHKTENIVSQPCFPKMDKQAKETLFPSHVSQRGTNGKTLTKILLEEPKGVSSSLGATFRPATSVDTFEQILWLQSFGYNVFQFAQSWSAAIGF